MRESEGRMMGEVELVIKLPEDKYNDIVEMYGTFPASWKEFGLAYIKNGIRLPKGHGRLIDADAVLEEPIGDTYKDIFYAKTVVEADAESEGER